MNRFLNSENFPTFARIGRALPRGPGYVGRGIAHLFKKTYKYTLALLIVLAVVHGVATFITGRRLEARINVLKARGVPVSMAELGLPKVPDEENAAVIYAKAFKAIEKLQTGGDYSKLNSFLKPNNRQGNPELWTDVRRMLAENRGAFPLVEEALSRPKCQFPVNWEAGFDADFPHSAPLRTLTRLLAADAIVQARDGRMDRAIHSIELCLQMGATAPDEATLVGSYVQIAMIKAAAIALRDMLMHGNISEAQARRLYQAFGSIDTSPGFLRAMQGDGALGIWIFDYVRKHPGALPSLTSGHGDSSDSFWWGLIGYLWRPFFYADELYHLDYMTAGVERSRLTFREAELRRGDAGNELPFPRWAIISNIFAPVFHHARRTADATIAETAGTQIVLALRVYKNRHGSYPASLDDLRAKLGWEIPKDIFSGNEFVYKRQGKGFLFYSIGENLKDDGGRVPPAKPWETMTAEERARDDIVWQMDR